MKYNVEQGNRYNLDMKSVAWTFIAIAALVAIYVFLQVARYLPC